MERELFYIMDMLFILALRPLVLCSYSLFLQEVLGFERFMILTRRLDIRKLLLASDYSNTLFFHGIYIFIGGLKENYYGLGWGS